MLVSKHELHIADVASFVMPLPLASIRVNVLMGDVKNLLVPDDIVDIHLLLPGEICHRRTPTFSSCILAKLMASVSYCEF